MGVTKRVLKPGNGIDRPVEGDVITMEYTGWLYDARKANDGYRGKMFDTSATRGPFITEIGVGKVVRGWDEGILQTDGGMTLGEKAILHITSDYGYAGSGFPGLIPPHSDLLFEVELLAINSN